MAFFDFLSGADEAEKAAKKATKKAVAFEQAGQDQAVNVLQPGASYAPSMGMLDRLSGLEGRQAQQDAFGQYQESPEVQFYREQGEQAAQRAAAAGGQLASGRTLADLTAYGQKLATTGISNWWDRITDIYKTKLGTANNIAGIRAGGGSRLADLTLQGGMQQANLAGQRGGVLGDLLSQGAALAAYAYGGGQVGTPGSSASSYGRTP